MLKNTSYVELVNGKVCGLQDRDGVTRILLAYLDEESVKLAETSFGSVGSEDTLASFNRTQPWYGGKIKRELTYQQAVSALLKDVFSDITTLDDEDLE